MKDYDILISETDEGATVISRKFNMQVEGLSRLDALADIWVSIQLKLNEKTT